MKYKHLTLLIFLLVITSYLSAHGVRVQVKQSDGIIIVKAEYDGGSVVKNASVTVRYETETMAPYILLKGKTHEEVNFKFPAPKPKPGEKGTLTISVDDGMGHMGEETFKLTSTETTPFSEQEMGTYLLKIVLGVGLILLITFILNRLKKDRETGTK